MTLEQYVKAMGSQEKAARGLGVSYSTVHYWLHGKHPPKGLYAAKLKRMGIIVTIKEVIK